MIANKEEIKKVVETLKSKGTTTVRDLFLSTQIERSKLYFILGILYEQKKVEIRIVGKAYAINYKGE
jgi:transcription initiation factor IIE alpha subunit